MQKAAERIEVRIDITVPDSREDAEQYLREVAACVGAGKYAGHDGPDRRWKAILDQDGR